MRQLDDLVAGLQAILGDRLVGVYVHGSWALGCFNPARSDLDVIAIAREAPAPEQRARLVDLLASVTDAPRPLEFHLLLAGDLDPWRHPAPFELHWHGEPIERGEDRDLAAHVTVARANGVALAGPPAQEVLPEVPWPDFEDSLRGDLEWTRECGRGLYRALSPLRVWAALATGQPHSKASAAEWAGPRLPPDLRPVAVRALTAYRGSGTFEHTQDELDRLLAFVESRV